MNLEALIQFADTNSLTAEVVRSVCEEERKSVQELFDAFAVKIARGYLEGRYPWQLGDGAMNSLFSYAYAFSDECLSDYARGVYEAFDEAEYVHPGDPRDFDHESRTRSMLQALKEEPNKSVQTRPTSRPI